MSKPTIFRATDPEGGRHYRSSENRTYSHAVLRKLDGKWKAIAFASRPDLAEKEAASQRSDSARLSAANWVAPERRAAHAACQIVTAPVEVVAKRGA